MFFTSTRARLNIDAAAAIARGISAEGGLFVPSEFPALTPAFLARLLPMTYRERAAEILSLLLPGFTKEEVKSCVDSAYTGTFDNDEPAPLYALSPEIRMLEYENKKDSDLRRSIRRSRERGHQPKKDTRAYYRGP